MKEPEIVTATEASRAFSELLHRVCYTGESFIIKKGNRLMARITPVEQAAEEKAPPKQKTVIQEMPAESLADGLTQEEADYYKTVVEQLNKIVLESV